MKNTAYIFINGLSFCFIYILLFVVLRNLFPNEIIFYQGMHLLEVLTLAVAIFYFLRTKSIEGLVTKLPNLCIGILLCYSFLMTLPVVIDRSITLHFLGYLSIHDSATTDDIREDFVKKFVISSAAIEKRLDEQASIGNIDLKDGRVSLSQKGNRMHHFFDYLAGIFKIKPTYAD